MKTKILLGLVAILTVFGCKDSFDNFDPDDPVVINPPVIEEFNASAFVEVVNSDGDPIEGAGITLGTLTASTNEYGVAYLEDVEMGSITYLTVDKVGFFHGSRRFYPMEGRTSYLRVMLLDEIVMGEFESGQGGSVTGQGVELDFPANAIMDASGNPYTGTVSVAMQAIAADDDDLSDKMPGDLVGQTLTGENEALASFGMVAVELYSPSGEELQVLTGEYVEMSVEVPSSMMGTAPATIPMWSFDEAKGIWVEEAAANLVSGRYVSQIPHFTWWNCDVNLPLIKFGATFVYGSGEPANQVTVCLTVGSLNTTRCNYTDDEGAICGQIIKGETMLMEVKDACGNVVYSQEIGPYEQDTDLGTITISETQVITTEISGTAINCDGDPVTDGFVRLFSGDRQYWITLEDDGTFNSTFINCSESDVILNVIDEEAIKQSLPQTFGFDEVIDAGTITVCEDIDEVITIEIPELDTSFTWLFATAYVSPNGTQIYTQDSVTNGSYIGMGFIGETEGTYAGWTELSVKVIEEPGGPEVQLFGTGDVSITVTYFGDTGDYIQGTFTGTLEGGMGPYNFTGTFNALRY